jgi:hypothetical protein
MTVPDRQGGPEPVAAPIFPIVMAVAWILEAFAGSGDPLPHLWRPLILTALLVGAITGVIWLAGRRRPPPLLVAGLAILLFLKAWPLLGVVVAGIVWRGLVALMRRVSHRPPLRAPAAGHVVNLANTFGLVLLLVALVSVVLSGVEPFPAQTATRGAAQPSAPNMYFVLLDGYPREDSLDALGIDNSSFLAELQERGFAVAPRSRTNYHNTLLTLTSMFNGRYLGDVPELSPAATDQAATVRQLSYALNRVDLLDDLRTRGYEIIDSPSVYGATTLFSADVLLSSGTINQFDQRILSRSYLGDLLTTLSPNLIDGWLRDAVLTPMRDVETIASSDAGSPRFMFAHVLSPHPPFLFDSAGELPEVDACYPSGCSLWTSERKVLGISEAEYEDLLADQLEFLNGRILEMVDQVAAHDPAAVIILFGDHGIRFDAGVSLEYFRNFFAARTPGHKGLFPADISPINVVTTLENAYLGTAFPTREYEAWESKGLLLNLSRWLPDPI